MTPFLNNPTEPTEASRILIVEDEAIVAESLKDQLINLGYQVCGTAANGEDAMRIMEHSEPDLVMMDIMLEGPMDGVEVAGRIREKNEIPVIFLTAYSDNETLQRAKITEPFGLPDQALQGTRTSHQHRSVSLPSPYGTTGERA